MTTGDVTFGAARADPGTSRRLPNASGPASIPSTRGGSAVLAAEVMLKNLVYTP